MAQKQYKEDMAMLPEEYIGKVTDNAPTQGGFPLTETFPRTGTERNRNVSEDAYL